VKGALANVGGFLIALVAFVFVCLLAFALSLDKRDKRR
jgi:hypothetical protein